MKRNRPSGFQQRKKQKAKNLQLQSMTGSILKFVAPSTSTPKEVVLSDGEQNDAETFTEDEIQPEEVSFELDNSENNNEVDENEEMSKVERNDHFIEIDAERSLGQTEIINEPDKQDTPSDGETYAPGKSDNEEDKEMKTDTFHDPSYNDIGDWPYPVPENLRVDLIKRDISELQNKDGPFSCVQRPQNTESGFTSRQMTTDWFFKNLPNGEKILRTWLAYSPKKQSLFCICCKLFCGGSSDKKTKKGESSKFISGFQTWWKLNPKVTNHENSDYHLTCLEKWKTLKAGVRCHKTIDSLNQAACEKERKRWKNVLVRLLDAILFLAKQNLPFRGHREHELSNNRGNFLELVKLLSKYDAVLKEHFTRLEQEASLSGKVLASYLSPSTQNEFITLLGNCVKEKIVSDIKNATYYGILFNSTPDVSHIEQMCEVIRYVHIESGKVEVKESFLGYFQLTGEKAADITDSIFKTLEKDGLDIKMCRSQGYDNAATMDGVHSGVQARIKEINPKALFVPCANHSLNLCGVHAFASVASCVTFFGTLESVYAFFSASTHRWEILMKCVGCSVKRLSDTRWSAQHDAIKPVFNRFPKLVEALDILSDSSESVETRGAAQNLSIDVCDYSFLCYLSLWERVLEEINHAQKYLQTRGISLEKCVIQMNSLKMFVNEKRVEVVNNSLEFAKSTCEKMDIPLEKRRRIRVKKRLPGETAKDESLTLPEELKRAMLECMDRLYQEITTRARGMEEINEKFLIVQTKNLLEAPDNRLQDMSSSLKSTYDEFLGEDMDLPRDIIRFRRYLEAAKIEKKQAKEWNSLKLLEFIVEYDFSDSLPSLTLALRIYLTICVSVASCERSFSKLKLIKSYLRSTMSQSRLSNLAILSVENQTANKIDFDSVITRFAEAKARRVKL